MALKWTEAGSIRHEATNSSNVPQLRADGKKNASASFTDARTKLDSGKNAFLECIDGDGQVNDE